VRASYLEIYNEEIRDLLVAKREKLPLKESQEKGFYVERLSEHIIKDEVGMEELLK
jgi:centromeric protein E